MVQVPCSGCCQHCHCHLLFFLKALYLLMLPTAFFGDYWPLTTMVFLWEGIQCHVSGFVLHPLAPSFLFAAITLPITTYTFQYLPVLALNFLAVQMLLFDESDSVMCMPTFCYLCTLPPVIWMGDLAWKMCCIGPVYITLVAIPSRS